MQSNAIWTPCRRLYTSFIDLLYPPICIHCEEGLESSTLLLCRHCSELATPLEPQGRCRKCFSEMATSTKGACLLCQKSPTPITAQASVWHYVGPPATLIKKLKYGNQPHLAKGIAQFLHLQFLRMNWPIPDAIIPVPMPLLRKLDRGFNQSTLIAEHLANSLNTRILEPLKRENGEFSQAGLSQEQRKKLKGASFRRNKRVSIEGKVLLLLDDVKTTGSTIRQCAYNLWQGRPKAVYSLTACMTEK